MTNFDVIEAYTEDFTKWAYRNYRGTAKITNNTIIGCHGNILIFNRTLTEYELSWVKNNMMCSKPQEPDIDL